MVEPLNRSHECPVCGESNMTELQFREHITRNHPQENPFNDMFPEYMVCDIGEYGVPVYLKIESEVGPFFTVKDESEYVERAAPYELYRHDWEWVKREETPFPEFEDAKRV